MQTYYYMVLIFFLPLLNGRKLPSYVKQCKRSDPELDKCMKNTMLDLRPYFRKGIPEMKLPSMNPFRTTKVEMDLGNFKMGFTNMDVYNLEKFEVEDFKMDFSENSMTQKMFSPLIFMRSNYTLDGRLLIFELQGSGYFESNFTDVHASIKLTGVKKTRNGKEYIKFESIDYHLDVGGGSIRLDNLFQDNPLLTTRTNEVLNDNIQEVIAEIKPVAETTISSITLSLHKAVFDNYSLDELFL